MRSTTKTQNTVTYIVLIIIGIIVFFIMGEEDPMIANDTRAYTTISQSDGVMPVYPLFAYACRTMFGEHYAYIAMVIIQGILAIVCTLYFTRFIQIECKLSNNMTVVVYLLSLIPFLTYLPEANISQIILTEGLALPLSYLMIVFIAKGFIDNRLSWLLAALGVAAILYLIRSQLLIAILLVSGFILIKLISSGRRTVPAVLLEVLASGAVAIGSFIICFVLFLGYLNYVVPLLEDKNKVVEETWYNSYIPQRNTDNSDDSDNKEDTRQLVSSSSQFIRLIMNRGIQFLEDDDFAVFDSSEKQEAYKVAINSIRNQNKEGLYIDNPIDWSRKWDEQGLVNERNVNYVIDGLSEYYRLIYPDYSEVEIWEIVREDIIQFSVNALRLHPIKASYVFVRLFFAGLQASIFVQPERFYVISEIITALLLIFTGILLFRSRKSSESRVIIFRIICVSVLVYSFIVSAIHYPLQRYLLYFQGMYYSGLFIVLVYYVKKWIREHDK